jgi:hypothetical protein
MGKLSNFIVEFMLKELPDYNMTIVLSNIASRTIVSETLCSSNITDIRLLENLNSILTFCSRRVEEAERLGNC